MSKELLAQRSMKLLAIAAAGSGALWLSSCSETSAQSNTQWGTENATATSVSLTEGAKIREESYVEDSATPDNLPIHITKDPVTIDVTRPVYESYDSNGQWIGIHEADLKKTFPQLSEKLSKDDDGMLWINHQKAEVNQ